MKKKVKVSIVSILKHAPLCAQCISALQKMSEGSSRKKKISLRNFMASIALFPDQQPSYQKKVDR